MKKIISTFFVLLCVNLGFAQGGLKLTNAIVIGQFDKPEDRYAVEVTLTEFFTQAKIKSLPSLNILKQGSPSAVLANDTLQMQMKANGYDTYLVVSVRGYDRKFKASEAKTTFAEILERTSIYHLYRDEATSVTFEFTFFRGNQVVYRDVLRCGNISNRDSVIKRFRKRLPKKVSTWKM